MRRFLTIGHFVVASSTATDDAPPFKIGMIGSDGQPAPAVPTRTIQAETITGLLSHPTPHTSHPATRSAHSASSNRPGAC